ncbi:MAG: lipase family protein [Clostridia bacterium]|nr:lipase family protein [Clostridia bacterium]
MKLYDLMTECIGITYSEAGTASNYALRRDGDTLYIFFESSNGRLDWQKNFDFPAKPYKRMGQPIWYAHRGFLSAWRDIEPMIAARIADTGIGKVIVTGYSHGAAIALLCHEYVWYNRPDLRRTLEGFGFGCPRVVWGNPSAELSRRWERFTVIRNIDDIVTHLPPAFIGYTHVGKLLTIGKAGKYNKVEAHYAENILAELHLYETAHNHKVGGLHIKFGTLSEKAR